jgi:hypothetical protein
MTEEQQLLVAEARVRFDSETETVKWRETSDWKGMCSYLETVKQIDPKSMKKEELAGLFNKHLRGFAEKTHESAKKAKN